MERNLRNATIVLIVLSALALLWSPGAQAEVRNERPRIWLTPEFKTTLIGRFGRNTTNARELRTWCDNHMNDDLSSYIDSRATSILQAINYALMYQLTANTSYANRAIEIIEYTFAHPYTNYTIDTWIEFDNFYTDRYLMPPVAIVLDWCYDVMTPTQRTTFANQLDRWVNNIITTEPWSWHDPSNNHYYGHMWAILTAGYAMYGLNANAQTYIDYARGTMLDQAIKFTKGETIMWDMWGTTLGRGKGGMWSDGTSYGCVDYEFLFSCIQATKSAEGLAYSGFTFPDEAVKFFIYAKHPSGDLMFTEGDGAKGTIDPTERIPILFAISLASGNTKQHGQYWINTYTSNCRWGYKLYNEFLWYDDQLPALDYHGALPDFYYLEGTQTLFWRSDWTQNALWFTMKLGLLNTVHAHNGLGNFMIFKQGFLATDKAIEAWDGFLLGDIDHNVLYIPPTEEKALYWGQSDLKHIENTPNYIYFAGDLSGPYLAQPSYRSNTVAHKDREILIVKPENVIAVMDRGTSFNAAQDKIFQMYLHNQAVLSGNDHRSSNGGADLIIHSAYPAAVNFTLDTYGAPRFRISTPVAQLSKSFLNLLKVTSPGGAFQAPRAISSAADVAVAAFYGAADPFDYLIAFSAHPNANPSAAASFTLDFERSHSATRAYLANLVPNMAYYVSGSVNGTAATVTVSRTQMAGATAYQSDANGLLFCEVNLGEAEQPPSPPPRVGID